MFEYWFHVLAGLAGAFSVMGLVWAAVKAGAGIRRGVATAIKNYKDLSDKIDTLWGFHMSRGHAEAVYKGTAYEEDRVGGRLPPLDERRLVLTHDLRRRFDAKRDGKELTVAQELREAYRTKHMTRVQLEMWVSREFKDWLVDTVCIPLGIFEAGCIAMAMAVAKEE